MNIAEFSIRKNIITLTFTVLMVLGGIQAFLGLSRLEDPEFTIKAAQVITSYPGATAKEVELEVTDMIEQAVQKMGQLKMVESQSMKGLSIVKVEIKDQYDKNALPQVWDELRRKVADCQNQLPPGAGPSWVNDDFGDVYGIMFTLSGEDFTYSEIQDYVDILKRELLLVDDVKKVEFFGDQPEVIYVEMKRNKMAKLGISTREIYKALSDKNIVVQSGMMEVGKEYISLNPTGEYTSEEQFGNLLVSKQGDKRLIYLKDIAVVKRGYRDPAKKILRVNGEKAIGVVISTVSGGNVVSMGKALHKRVKELVPLIPLGMEFTPIYIQSEKVADSIAAFMVNLGEAVLIVIVVLLFFMGLKSGLIIGFILFLTICGTFIVMDIQDIILQRISLGALIIALGMLVDNAIVVVEGIKVRIESGDDAIKTAKDVVGQTAMPLLGATVVAILAFASIGVSDDSTGEYCRSLYEVILISLSLSWVTAVTVTPLLCKMFIRSADTKGEASVADPYSGKMFVAYGRMLKLCLKYRVVFMAAVVGLFISSLIGFKYVKQSFFPASTAPHFTVDVWYPEGTHIETLAEELKPVEDMLLKDERISDVSLCIGSGFPRFLLTYSPENPSSCYAQFLVTVSDYRLIDSIMQQVEANMQDLIPDAITGAKKFLLGPGEGGKVQIRIMGPEIAELRELAATVKDIMIEDGGLKTIRDEWRRKVKVIRPQFAQAQSQKTGITRQNLAETIEAAFSGKTTGVLRQGDDLIPIIARSPEKERKNVDSINNLQIWSPVAGRMLPVSQVVSGFTTEFEDANIWRRNRMRMLRIHADPNGELASEVFRRIKPKIEQAVGVDTVAALGYEVSAENFSHETLPVSYMKQMPLKKDSRYSIGWDGEAEDSTKGQAAVKKNLPLFLLFMIVVVVCLFNAFKQPAIIWLTVPLALIGVTLGLLVCNGAFGFMAMLGLLSLSGMLIKNAIVLIDQIDLEIKEGKDPYQAIVDSGISRMRPVSMAAATTILGMFPLLQDAFFVDMAITIMFGLGFATLLTLFVVPVLYAIFFKVKVS